MNLLYFLVVLLSHWKHLFQRSDTERSLDTCGCACYCPGCRGVLNLHARWQYEDGDHGTYDCPCGTVSKWGFFAPVPILLSHGS